MISLRRLLPAVVLAFAAGSLAAAEQPPAADGAALYQQYCERCHGGTVSKAPPYSLLQIMSASSVLRAMESGVMQSHAAAMSAAERRRLAEHLTGQALVDAGDAQPPAPQCTGDAARFDFSDLPAAKGWGVGHDNRRFFDAGITRVDASSLPTLELKWAFAFPDAIRARSQPAAAGGALYVGSQNGTVYALDRESGCIRWTFSTVAEVRTGIVVATWQKGQQGNPLIYFGDLVGNVYAVDAVTGELAWRDRPDDHPSLTLTAAPVLYQGLLLVPMSALEVTEAADPHYACCTFRGGVAAYDALTGERLWVGYTIDQPPQVVGRNAVGTDRIAPSGAPIWGTPTIDPRRGVMYVGTGENYSSPANDTSDAILALSLEDGRIVWRQQMTAGDAWNMGCETEEKINCPPENGPDYDFGAATILATTAEGKDIVLAGQKSGEVFGLDPDAGGRILWRQKLGRGGIQGGVHFGMAVDGDTLYVPMSDFDGGPRWPGEAKPGMYAVDVATGRVKWFNRAVDVCEGREFCQPGISAAASAIPGAVVAGGMDGWLRAYDRESGRILWQFDTAVQYQTLNGSLARGGSIGGGAGPVFRDEMMFVNSGYGIYFHMPGNVLLAFGPSASDGKPEPGGD
jgi:polyvinyl alcohol dehydrogenase (cytochrome)